nr:hypothetical protein [Methylobacterium segetis]
MPIATRTLRLLGPGSTENVTVRLYRPEVEDGGWICRYAIGWPDVRTTALPAASTRSRR